jgi:hypothetical protein
MSCGSRTDTGDRDAGHRLAPLLVERGDLDELRSRADAGDDLAASRLAVERGDMDELRSRADAGDHYTGERLADLLAERGDLDGLRGEVDAGLYQVHDSFFKLLNNHDPAAAERIRRNGLDPGP